jgi:hypothetical protein
MFVFLCVYLIILSLLLLLSLLVFIYLIQIIGLDYVLNDTSQWIMEKKYLNNLLSLGIVLLYCRREGHWKVHWETFALQGIISSSNN